jgi:hypothetical protein
MPNSKQKYPGIPVVNDDRVLAPTVRTLAEIVGLLIGQRGDGSLAIPSNLQSWMEDIERRVKALEP